MDPLPPTGSVDPTSEKHSEGDYMFGARARLAWVRRFRKHGDLLEVGCGGAYFLAAAQEAGFRVKGVDPDPHAVQYAAERYGIAVEQACIETSELADESFDVIFHVDLMSHFPDPRLALESMKRRLRPGGYLCFEVGGQSSLSALYFRLLGTAGYPFHLWLYEARAIRALLERMGLELVEIRRFGLLASITLQALANSATPLLGRRAKARVEGRSFGQVSSLRSVWDRMQHFCRYRMGRWMPPIGPQTLWVAARLPPRP